MESLYRVQSSLDAVGVVWNAKGSSHLMAQCPAHPDRSPSLSVDHKGDRTLLKCHAGCEVDEVVAALGLTFPDLFDVPLSPDDKPEYGMVTRSYYYKDWQGNDYLIKDRLYPKSFRQRLPGTEPGDRRGIGGRPGIFYRLPELLAGISEGRSVWLVEGEKDVDRARAEGLLATCVPAITGKWEPGYTTTLARAKGVNIVVDQDKVNPQTGKRPGREFAVQARAELRAAGIRVRCLRAKSGKDLSDHFDAGHKAEDFLVDTSVSTRPRGMTGDVLLQTDFPALQWAIPGLVPAGLTILASGPKVGKSWMGLDMALGVAHGGVVLSGIPANLGSTLYLAREDGYRRVQSRMDYLLGGDRRRDLSRFEVIPAEEPWEGGAVGISALVDWAEEVENPLMVVLDTLAKVEPNSTEGDRYRHEYAMMARYKQFADHFNVAVVVIHHDRKSSEDDGDIFSKISGTKGLTGAADTMLYIDRKRGETEGKLHVTGRDVAEQELPLRKSGPVWVLQDGANPEMPYLRVVRDA